MFSPANSNAARSSRQNHHQRSCCRIAAGSTSKEGSGTQTSNHQNRVMLFYAILKKHTCSPRPLNVWQRLTLALAIALLFLPAPWLKPGRPHLFGWLLLFAGSLQSTKSNIACRPWWRRTPRCPTTGSPGRDVLTCCGLLWSRIVGDPDLGGFWRRSGTGVPRRRQHTVHRHNPRYALFQLSTSQPVGPGLLQRNRHQHRAPCAKVVVVRFGAGVWPLKRCDVDNQTSIESTEQLQS